MRVLRQAIVLVLASLHGVAACQPVSTEDALRYLKSRDQSELFVRSGQAGKALDELAAAVKIYGQDGDLRYAYGQALHQAKRYEEAILQHQAALKLGGFANKFEAGVNYDIACAHALLGQKEKAFAALQKAMDLGFRDIQHVRTDKDLAALRSDARWEKLAATKDVAKMSRDEAWRYDVWFAARELRRIHLNPYRFHSSKSFDDHVRRLDRDIPKLKDEQIVARLQQMFAMAGDGHTGLRPPNGSPMMRALPIQAVWFEEGVFITAAAPAQAAHVGKQIVAIEGLPIERVAERLDPFISRDNAQNVKATLTTRIMIAPLMFGVGIAKSPDRMTLTLRDAAGQTQDITLEAGTAQADATWATARAATTNPPLYLKDRATPLWMERLPELDAVYVQYNAVRDGDESVAAFAHKLFETMDRENIERLILDVRWNGGGNTFLSRPLHEGIMRRERLNKRGNLFLITGRNTFSAAQNFTTDITRFANPITVGEPTGSSPNFVGESIRITLPYSKVMGSISDLFWQRSWPMDSRTWIPPQLPAPPSFELFKENRDPAMEAIAAFLEGKS